MKNTLPHALVLILNTLITFSRAQCPWQTYVPELQSTCVCSYNLGHELSVQCDMVNWPKLLTSLNKYAQATTLDLLYVNNSTIGTLKNNIFVNLQIENIQMSNCKITAIEPLAFKGQEQLLKNLNLQDNLLQGVPVESIKNLRILSLLDLSHNRIHSVPKRAFATLKNLVTLKLSENDVVLDDDSLLGLENCLKNLNLRATKQTNIPKAIQNMKTLTFLDLSQNNLRELPGMHANETFKGLDSLTAINLERNLIQLLNKDAFDGVQSTLSSLSLLNNLLAEFPMAAIKTLSELRVLDIGFNLFDELPVNAFEGNPSITLLALDGNPLTTLPEYAFVALNNTLRGLSVGGRFLNCDCRIEWLINWIRRGNIQVTSREKNPQFCGSPSHLRDISFYSIQPTDLPCNNNTNVYRSDLAQKKHAPVVLTIESTTKAVVQTTTTKPAVVSVFISTTSPVTSTTTPSTTQVTTTKTKPTKSQQKPSPNLNNFPLRSKSEPLKKIVIKSAFRQDNSVIIQWKSENVNLLGFRVLYRLFGDKSFKQGPPLEISEREFKIKNVPSQECIVVCVITLDETNISPENIPYNQCSEVRTVSFTSNVDKITIAASAAICGTIVVAVIIFIVAYRRRSRILHELHQHKLKVNPDLPIASLPVNCCTGLATSSEPLSSLAKLNSYHNKDWDQLSTYSAHRQRTDFYADELPQQFSSKRKKSHSGIDNHSQHSYSNYSERYLSSHVFPNNLLNIKPDIRHSRQSLAMKSERSSIRNPHECANSVASSVRKSRSKPRPFEHHRPSSRYSTAGSTHTLNNYGEADNWTDHDMDIYMARNSTKNGLVPL